MPAMKGLTSVRAAIPFNLAKILQAHQAPSKAIIEHLRAMGERAKLCVAMMRNLRHL